MKSHVVIMVGAAVFAAAVALGAYFLVFRGTTQDVQPVAQNTTPVVLPVQPAAPVAEPTSTAQPVALKVNFQYPYPVSWREGDIQFDLTGISLVENELSLKLKIKSERSSGSVCAELSIRRLINEEGDLLQPKTGQFTFPGVGECFIPPNTTYADQKVVFDVGPDDKEFTLTTGGTSNVFFSIKLTPDGKLDIENLSAETQG